MKAKRAPYWNIWWTLMVVSMAFTLLVVILEVYGVFRDAGIILGAIGILVSLSFGFTASTRSSMTVVTTGLADIADDMKTTHAILIRIEALLAERLPALAHHRASEGSP